MTKRPLSRLCESSRKEESRNNGSDGLYKPPYVTVNGQRYFSDRFYLNKVNCEEEDYHQQQRSETESLDGTPCHCGARGAPHLFDRSALLKELDLHAAILGTFSLDPQWLVEEFPSLFAEDARVPTLVLHGRKGFQIDCNNKATMSVDSDDDDVSNCSFDQEDPKDSAKEDKAISPNVVWSEITSSWIPPVYVPLSRAKWLHTDGLCLNESLLQYRMFRKGVYHPKFMILLEKSGSVVVVVSTSNLTQPNATDASWVQRFPPSLGRGEFIVDDDEKESTTDFGAVLGAFLEAQTLSTRAGQVTPLGFVKKQLQWNSLRDIARRFDYSQAKVHLVPTVPGDFAEIENHTSSNPSLLRGRQRTDSLLKILSNCEQPWLPGSLLSDEDVLIMQPTSLGGDWNRSNLGPVLRSYLTTSASDLEVLEQARIVWPTDRFMKHVLRGGIASCDQGNGRSVNVANVDDRLLLPAAATTQKTRTKVIDDVGHYGYCFLSSETFNRIDLTCLSQMVRYQPSIPRQMRALKPPHLKTISRVFQGNDYQLYQEFGLSKGENIFSHCMLTSACLSRGAQGVSRVSAGKTVVSYANFELGILFISRLQGLPESDRVYGFRPRPCQCHSRLTGGRKSTFIHLPLPFDLQSPFYQTNPEQLDFEETPYFHEVTPSTSSVGHMKLTPYGAAWARRNAG